MKLTQLLTKTAANTCYELKKNSPTLLMVGGAIGVVGATVLACAATLRLNDILDEAKDRIDDIHAVKPTLPEEEKEQKKEIAKVYVKTGAKITKSYIPAVAVGGLSLTAMFASNHKLKERTASATAAYVTLDSMFRKYRKNVIEELGDEADKRFRYGIKKEKITETVVDEDGKQHKKTTEVDVISKDNFSGYSDYARFFDESCIEWESDPEYNLMFLKLQENYANDKLRLNGHLFLNEVYDMLGIKRTKAGNVVGWVYDEKNPVGDNFVDFGIYDMRERNAAFVNGYEPVILLDFNVDGPILDFLK